MNEYDSIEKLIGQFDSCIRDELLPFMRMNGLSHSVGQSDFSDDPVVGLNSSKYSEPISMYFCWVNRFIGDKYTFDISYGGPEQTIEARIFCQGQWLGCWELLSAANMSDAHMVSGNAFVCNRDFMKATIKALSFSIKDNWEILSSCNIQLIESVLKLREERSKNSRIEQEKNDMKIACIKASNAFHSQQYRDAIKLLEPYQNSSRLPKTSVKLLAMARKHTE